MKRRCSCGTVTSGTFPSEARATTSYGPNIRASALYLLHGQHLSVERTAQALSQMLGAKVPTGFVASLSSEAAGRLTGFLDVLRARLAASAVIHVDETSTSTPELAAARACTTSKTRMAVTIPAARTCFDHVQSSPKLRETRLGPQARATSISARSRTTAQSSSRMPKGSPVRWGADT